MGQGDIVLYFSSHKKIYQDENFEENPQIALKMAYYQLIQQSNISFVQYFPKRNMTFLDTIHHTTNRNKNTWISTCKRNRSNMVPE